MLEELKRDFEGEEYSRRLESRVRKEGYIALGVPGEASTLIAAMITASPEVVSMLLESGANVGSVDVNGQDGFMLASAFGRPKNLQCWLERVKDWDLSRQNTVLGGCALANAVYMGANKLGTVNALMDAGASLNYRTFAGGNVLIGAVDNEDSDPDVVRIVLEKIRPLFSEKEFTSFVNYRYKASTFKWKVLYFVSKNLNRTGLSKSGLMYAMSLWPGTTALSFAVMRGDVEIVKILLENGADPFVENDLGMNAFDLCDKAGPFPSVNKATQARYQQTRSSHH